ncbi:MAG: hypothetical protein IKJ93_01085 [Clostridia bacterium]|nr:hypothetical protein [Clostridia bacterium]
MSLFIKKALYPVLIFTCIFAIVLYFIKDYKQKSNSPVYMLKSYRNTVALYQNDKLLEIYENIVLNTLPQKDIQSFNNGITFGTEEQAEIYLEDFE